MVLSILSCMFFLISIAIGRAGITNPIKAFKEPLSCSFIGQN